MGLKEVQQDWTFLGDQDPLWAILSDPRRRGGGWDEQAFFATGKRDVAALLDLTGARAAGRCLDFGCGVGRLTLPFAAHFREVVGVDISPSMIARAERYRGDAHNVTYFLNQSRHLRQFPDARFEFINASIVLQHMEPGLALGYLREFARLLSPGGQLVFTLPNRPESALKALLYQVLPPRVLSAWKRRRRVITHMEMHCIPVDRVIIEIEQAGLTVGKVRSSRTGGPGWRAFLYCCSK